MEPEYDVDLPDNTAGGDAGDGDDTSRAADTSRGTATGAPNGRPAGGNADQNARPDSQSPAGGNQTGAGAMVPSGLLREANRQIRRLTQQIAAGRQQPRPEPAARTQPEPEPLDPETQAIKAQLFRVVPWLAKLERLDPDAVDRLINEVAPQNAERTASLERLYWQRNGNATLREVEQLVRTEYGEKADPRAIRRFQAGFLDWIETDEDARERYLDGDPSLVKDYWAETTGLIVEPIRSRASEAAVKRAERVNMLPRMPGRGGPVGAPRRTEKKPKDENELHDQAWDALVERAGAISR